MVDERKYPTLNRNELNHEYQPVTHTLALRFNLEKILQKILACVASGSRRERGGREGKKREREKGGAL